MPINCYHIAGKFGGTKFTRFEHLAKKVWRMNKFSQKVIDVSKNLVWQIR